MWLQEPVLSPSCTPRLGFMRVLLARDPPYWTGVSMLDRTPFLQSSIFFNPFPVSRLHHLFKCHFQRLSHQFYKVDGKVNLILSPE